MSEGSANPITGAMLGLPPKFHTLRAVQVEAIEWAKEQFYSNLEDKTCAAAACLPTGTGKTAFAVGLSQEIGCKTAYLVSTKALQDQVLGDFHSIGVVDVRGRANYSCPNYGNCEAGVEEECSLSNTMGCLYTKAVERAKMSRLAVTNYAYWLHARDNNPRALEYCAGAHGYDFGGEDEPIGLLICDEAHRVLEEVSRFVSVRVYRNEISGEWPQDIDDSGLMCGQMSTWGGWCARQERDARGIQLPLELKEGVAAKKDIAWIEAQDLIDRSRRIAKMRDNWVWQFSADRKYVDFEPIHLQQFWRSLFSGVPRVLLMSATLTQYALNLLLPPEVGYTYRAWPAVFPPQNAPLYHIPVRKLTWRSTEDDYAAVVAMMDQIIDARLDRKGIIHTVSYQRAQTALRLSRHARRMFWNGSAADSGRVVSEFKAAPPGALLVSPSVGTGWDFPGEAAEYQIVLKFPYPNETSRVIKERCKQIPNYRLFCAAQDLVQMAGRAVRSTTDRCETFVLDNSIAQLKGPAGKQLLPPGFRIWTVTQIPAPPPKSARSTT